MWQEGTGSSYRRDALGGDLYATVLAALRFQVYMSHGVTGNSLSCPSLLHGPTVQPRFVPGFCPAGVKQQPKSHLISLETKTVLPHAASSPFWFPG